MADDVFTQRKAVGDLAAAFAALRGESRGFSTDLALDLKASTTEIRRAEQETRSLTRSMGYGLRRAFDSAVFGGAKLSDVMRGLALDFSRSALNTALRPLQTSLAGGLADLFSGGAFADGGTFSSGRVRAFAEGGVVRQATAFPMRGGLGLMGEAGPEAVMPLSRGADGKLGVNAEGSSGVSVTVNIQTRDAESFRRSQSQVAAAITRAVARGRRNL